MSYFNPRPIKRRRRPTFAVDRFKPRSGITRQPRSFKAFLAGPNKFGAYSANYNGRIFDSRMEALHAANLDQMRRATKPEDRVVDVKFQVRVPLDVNGHHIADYYCDFLVKYADGREQYEEVKGFETDVWRLKEKLFRAIYPDRVLKVIR